MEQSEHKAQELLQQFRGNDYIFGSGVLDRLGDQVALLGQRVLLVGRFKSAWFRPIGERVTRILHQAGVEIAGTCQGAAPNAPFEDVYRIHSHLVHTRPDAVVVVDAGSGIDAVKAAVALATFGDVSPEVEAYLGVGRISSLCQQFDRTLTPVVAVMLAASSAAHLTKYANVTDMRAGQKSLIVDPAVVPTRALFDYDLTTSQPLSLTLDGAFDGIVHVVEVYFGAGPEMEDLAGDICETALDLILPGVQTVARQGDASRVRTRLGLGTDLGGYAIMVGGTSGPHLNSFSLVDVLAHGRACALLHPYYTVFFAPAIQAKLRRVGAVYKRHGLIKTDLDRLSGRDLGLAVAAGMLELLQRTGLPTTLQDLPTITRDHIARCLHAAKDPALASKLENMPVALHAGNVDRYMGAVLDAAWTGDFSLIHTMET
ncbi:iron-containing alcohol dehydrogenase [Desulfoplanes formicivorans]|uniref:3-dehydroquinate synthase n=1 Tax=Desulfoplanes formicivorans TaxID=1592317 RepID=A0A194AKV5_9BACT|nr:iron-containing alcohol dehydrogenase [Desulfoplanes formicivorans]GAU09875.1 3-dehydroquinate synthase [Desulfoplanes formicivorans]